MMPSGAAVAARPGSSLSRLILVGLTDVASPLSKFKPQYEVAIF